MPTETRSFLRDRASTETAMAAGTDCGPAAWSHSRLAQLYLERCIGTGGEATECGGCEMGDDCLGLQPGREPPLM